MTPDYIVVGGGTAGSVLAESLTACGKHRVVLVEAGGAPPRPWTAMPAGFTKLFKGKADWAYQSAVQSRAHGRSIFIPRGRMLGGSSNMSAQIHQWCHPADFDGWRERGADGWGWNDVAPWFAAQEHFEAGQGLRGKQGRMHVACSRDVHPAARDFVAAANTEFKARPPDYNGGTYEGAWVPQLAHRDGRRFSAYDAFLRPAMARANLTVVTHAHVHRILIEAGKAVGIEYQRGERIEELRANAGVILSAGTIGSPTILMHTGVGPPQQLRRCGIQVIWDSPEVGANLQDHPMAVLTLPTRHDGTYKTAASLPNLVRYLLRRGPLTSNAVEGIAFGRSTSELQAPDMELLFAPLEWRNEALSDPQIHAFAIGAAVLTPQSRGHVTLASGDPLADPTIDFGIFSDPEDQDRKTMHAAIHWALRVAGTAPFTRHLLPLDKTMADQVNEALDTIQTVYHPSGTCRMGKDPHAVVCPDLSVNGVGRLWVADASIMPTIPRGHPNAVVAMIAGRAAGLILGRSASPIASSPSDPARIAERAAAS